MLNRRDVTVDASPLMQSLELLVPRGDRRRVARQAVRLSADRLPQTQTASAAMIGLAGGYAVLCMITQTSRVIAPTMERQDLVSADLRTRGGVLAPETPRPPSLSASLADGRAACSAAQIPMSTPIASARVRIAMSVNPGVLTS